MSGSVLLDGQQAPWDPIHYQWARERLATAGNGQPVFSAYWSVDMDLPHEAQADWDWFFSRFVSAGPHVLVFPAPGSEVLTIYSGVAFDICEAAHEQIGGWFMSPKLKFSHVYLSGGVNW